MKSTRKIKIMKCSRKSVHGYMCVWHKWNKSMEKYIQIALKHDLLITDKINFKTLLLEINMDIS